MVSAGEMEGRMWPNEFKCANSLSVSVDICLQIVCTSEWILDGLWLVIGGEEMYLIMILYFILLFVFPAESFG